jgi:hypothetical protein
MSSTVSLTSLVKRVGRSIKKSTGVRFDETYNVHYECPAHCTDLTEEETQAVWYTRADCQTFYKLARDASIQARQALLLHLPTLEETRGLEDNISSRAVLERRARKQAVRKAVFGEQAAQRERQQEPDALRIAKRSMLATKGAKLRAYELAALDASTVVAEDDSTQSESTDSESDNGSVQQSTDEKQEQQHLTLAQMHMENQRRLLTFAMTQTTALRA